MESIINEIKKCVDHSIELSLNTLRELKKESHENRWNNEFALTVNATKSELIEVSGQYAINKFKKNKIEKSPSPLYHWIVDEVNDRFDQFIQNECTSKPISI